MLRIYLRHWFIFNGLLFALITGGLEIKAEVKTVKIQYPLIGEDNMCYVPLGSDFAQTISMTSAPLSLIDLFNISNDRSTPRNPLAALESSDEKMTDVDQLIDPDASNPLDLFRFSPAYVELNPGDSIRFLNSLGKHTVLSMENMMPEGAKPFAISHQKVAEVKFEKPGIYGIRCRVHYRYGMVMLVKVGKELPNLEQAKKAKVGRRAKKKFKELFQQLEASSSSK